MKIRALSCIMKKRGGAYAKTEQFRSLQIESKKLSANDIQLFHSGDRTIDETIRGRFSRGVESIFLDSRNYGVSNDKGVLVLSANGNEFRMRKGVNGALFHDIILYIGRIFFSVVSW